MDEPGASSRRAICTSSAGRLATGLGLVLLALLACALLMSDGALASTDPPASGDWVIESGESVSHTGKTLDVRGDIRIYGVLWLRQCQVWVWSEAASTKGIVVGNTGRLEALMCNFGAGDPLLPFYIDARPGSVLALGSCGVTRAGVSMDGDGSRSGVHVATACELSDLLLQDCLVGLWVDGASVSVTGYSIVRCRVGVAVTDGGDCTMNGTGDVGIVECDIGALVDSSFIGFEGGAFLSCREGLVAYSSRVLLQDNCTFTSTTLLAAGVYGSSLTARDTSFAGCAADALVVHTSTALLQRLWFSDCTNDIRLVSSDATILHTEHAATEDAAVFSHLSTFRIDGVLAEGCYWGLRAHRSSGVCANLTTFNVTYSVQATMCDGLRIEGLDATGTFSRPDYSEHRGLYLQDSNVTVVNCTLARMRNGLYADGMRGLVEGVSVSDCTREGVIVHQSTLTMRGVTVTNATDGFLLAVYSRARLEGCTASYCRAAGFNVTSGASDALVGCVATGCATPDGTGAGIATYLASPRVIDCTVRQYDRAGRPLPMTKGIDCVEASPRIEGGDISGAGTGIHLTRSAALVSGVTFHHLDRQCILVENSSADEVRGCLLLGQAGCAGVVVYLAGPLIQGNTMRDLHYGILAYNQSRPRIVGNLIERIEWDGVLAHTGCSMRLEGNTIRNCVSNALTVALDSSASSHGDLFELSSESNVLVQLGGSLDMEGSTTRLASIGLHAQGARSIRVAFCEFRDGNQGIRVEPLGVYRGTDVRVEGCYFTNHSSYCIGATASNLTVVDCTMLDNMAGIHVWDATSPVMVYDCSIVGAWLYGLTAEGSEVWWTVERACRVVDADINGHVLVQVMAGAKLEIVGSRLSIVGEGCYWYVSGGALVMRDVQMAAPSGCFFQVTSSDVTIVGCELEGLGVPGDTSPNGMGMYLGGSTLAATNTTIRRSDAGLVLVQSTAALVNVTILECNVYGLYVNMSTLSLLGSTVSRVATGTCLHAVMTTLTAELTEFSLCRAGLELHSVGADLVNCSIGGMASTGIEMHGGLVSLVNTTYDPASVSFKAGGVIEVYWYLSARVVWANATELPSAEVTVLDGSGQTLATLTPGEDGRTATTLVLAVIHTPDGVGAEGPHTITARLHGFAAIKVLTLTSSVEVVLRLLDEAAPELVLVSPSAPETWSRSATIEVFGRAVDVGSGTRTVEARLDYATVPAVSHGEAFTFTFKVTSGRHAVVLRGTDWAGNAANMTLVFNVETTPLALALSSPADGGSSNATAVEVVGLLSRAGATVRVNGALATVNGTQFGHSLPLVEGTNAIRVEVTDVYGYRATANLTVRVDRTPPGLNVTSPALVNTTLAWVRVVGNVSADAELTINDVPVLVRDGAFDVSFPVGMGESFVVVRAVDPVGNAVEVRVLVDRLPEEEPPEGPDWWEAVPFAVILPILMVAEWYVIIRPDRREGGT